MSSTAIRRDVVKMLRSTNPDRELVFNLRKLISEVGGFIKDGRARIRPDGLADLMPESTDHRTRRKFGVYKPLNVRIRKKNGKVFIRNLNSKTIVTCRAVEYETLVRQFLCNERQVEFVEEDGKTVLQWKSDVATEQDRDRVLRFRKSNIRRLVTLVRCFLLHLHLGNKQRKAPFKICQEGKEIELLHGDFVLVGNDLLGAEVRKRQKYVN